MTPGGVNYVVTNEWSGCFFTYDIPPGIYRVDLNGTNVVLSSVKASDSFSRNTYYSDKTGVDIYSSTVYSVEIILSEDGKIGFALPQGEGVAHPSIIRVL